MEAKSHGEEDGTTVVVRLPVAPERFRVLVVEDEEDTRDLLGYMFAASGMEFRAAASVEEAMTILDGFVPDVIISDIGMPFEDGFSFIRRIRALPDDRAGIPAIALTAFAGTEERRRAIVDGFNVHLAKPVEPAKLVHAILELVEASRLSSKRPA